MNTGLLSLVLGVAFPTPEIGPPALREMQGVWRIVRVEHDGSVIGADLRSSFVVEHDLLKDVNVCTVGISTSRIKLTGKDEIDLIPQEGSRKGKSHPGIFLLKGSTLTICTLATPRDMGCPDWNYNPPTSFEAKKDSNHILYVLERSSPDALKGLKLMRFNPAKGIVEYRWGEEGETVIPPPRPQQQTPQLNH